MRAGPIWVVAEKYIAIANRVRPDMVDDRADGECECSHEHRQSRPLGDQFGIAVIDTDAEIAHLIDDGAEGRPHEGRAHLIGRRLEIAADHLNRDRVNLVGYGHTLSLRRA